MGLNTIDVNLGGGSLLQLANRSILQMMSYIIDTPDGKIIVIDGGNNCKEDAECLYGQIEKRGKHVDLWIITHAHQDHFGALLWILKNRKEIKIDTICFHFPKKEWLITQDRSDFIEEFLNVLDETEQHIKSLNAGDEIVCGGIRVEAINEPVNYEDYSNINSTSQMFLVHFPKQTILFMGDFDSAAEENFLKYFDIEKLRCDIVQMAHHGQSGVTKAFYELIRPKICLYTAPMWLWENNLYKCLNPETRGKGYFTTLETRQWMEDMGAVVSCPHAYGDYYFV